ncbi:TetR/AcrR family transcriptional regulator [Streptomyces sp. NPDC058464]|uniref:TetR/AcrR family transcriptional regulator n=1 Tax=Streptomyces sp. NPDC058464 TaxID=3346511 RepID=UPI00365C4A38
MFQVWQTEIMSGTGTRPRSPRGGRPTRGQAAQLEQDIRAHALAVFLEQGYEATKMDAIASAAGTTKATLYARFSSKEALFQEVVQWAIVQPDWPIRESEPPDLDDLEVALRAVAQAAVRRALHPSMVKLARIAIAKADRFPDLARQTYAAPTFPRRRFVVQLLERHAATGAIALPGDTAMLAELFLGLVASVPARLASLGILREPEVQEEHTELAVQVFLRSLHRC